MMKFVRVIGYIIPVLLVGGLITLPFYWLLDRMNNDSQDGTNRWQDGGCGVGCMMTIANLALLAFYVATIVLSARMTIGVLDQLVHRFNP